MATSFRGWGTSWANAWGPIAVDPNAMIGAAGFNLTAIATLTAGSAPGDMSGSAGLTFSALGILVNALELPTKTYYGSGRTAGTRANEFTEADIERLVSEKWEAIEKAQRTKPKPSVKPAAKPSPEPLAKVEPASIVAPLVIEIKAPLLPAIPARAAIEPIAPDPDEALQAQAAIRAKREQQEAEFLLMLAAL